MNNQFKAQATAIIIAIIALIIAAGSSYLLLQNRSQKVAVETTTTIPTPTTQEPTTITITATPTTKSVFVAPSNWIVYKDTKNGFEFAYPKHFFYSDPVVAVYDCSNFSAFPSTCSEFDPKYYYPGISNERPEGNKIVINNMQFCVNNVNEGAMGSTYDTVFYTTLKNKKCIVIKTVIQTNNDCVDAVNPAKCEAGNQNNYTVLNQVISTLHFFNPNGN
jgi:hypothetical protein